MAENELPRATDGSHQDRSQSHKKNKSRKPANKSGKRSSNPRHRIAKNSVKQFKPQSGRIFIADDDFEFVKQFAEVLLSYWEVRKFNLGEEFKKKFNQTRQDCAKLESFSRLKEKEIELFNELMQLNEKILLVAEAGFFLDERLGSNHAILDVIQRDFSIIKLIKKENKASLFEKNYQKNEIFKQKELSVIENGYKTEREILASMEGSLVDISDVPMKDAGLRVSQMLKREH